MQSYIKDKIRELEERAEPLLKIKGEKSVEETYEALLIVKDGLDIINEILDEAEKQLK